MRRIGMMMLLVAARWNMSAQESVLLKLPAKGKSIHEFVPINYDTLATASGDLNKDGVADLALVLAYRGEDSLDMDDPSGRALLVLLREGDEYRLAGESDQVILCKQCGGVFGDPFAGIDITPKGILEIYHYGGSNWRWALTDKFRYQQGAFFLIGSTSDSFWIVAECDDQGVGNAGRTYRDVNWITGDEEIMETDENCKQLKHEKNKLKKAPLVQLESFSHD